MIVSRCDEAHTLVGASRPYWWQATTKGHQGRKTMTIRFKRKTIVADALASLLDDARANRKLVLSPQLHHLARLSGHDQDFAFISRAHGTRGY